MIKNVMNSYPKPSSYPYRGIPGGPSGPASLALDVNALCAMRGLKKLEVE